MGMNPGFVQHADGTATLVFDKKAVHTDEAGNDSIVLTPARLLYPGPCNPAPMAEYASKHVGRRVQVQDRGDGLYVCLPTAQAALGIEPKVPKGK